MVRPEPMCPAFVRVASILQEDPDNLMVRVSAATVTLVTGSNFVKRCQRCHSTALTSLFCQGSISRATAQYHTNTRKITASKSASPVAIASVSRDSLSCAASAPLQRHSWSPHHQSSEQHRRRQQPDGPVTDLLTHRLAAYASACGCPAILTRPRAAPYPTACPCAWCPTPRQHPPPATPHPSPVAAPPRACCSIRPRNKGLLE
jgi:hypothetical protein